MLTADDIRRKNFRDILKNKFEGSIRAMAQVTEQSENYLSKLIGNTNSPRLISSNSAREMEKKLGLAKGWADNIHSDNLFNATQLMDYLDKVDEITTHLGSKVSHKEAFKFALKMYQADNSDVDLPKELAAKINLNDIG